MIDSSENDSNWSNDQFSKYHDEKTIAAIKEDAISIELKNSNPYFLDNAPNILIDSSFGLFIHVGLIFTFLGYSFCIFHFIPLLIVDLIDDYWGGNRITLLHITISVWNHLQLVIVYWYVQLYHRELLIAISIFNLLSNRCSLYKLKYMPHHFFVNFVTNIILLNVLRKIEYINESRLMILGLVSLEFSINYVPILLFQMIIYNSREPYLLLQSKESADSSHMRLCFNNGVYIHLTTPGDLCVISMGKQNRKITWKDIFYIPTYNYGIINNDILKATKTSLSVQFMKLNIRQKQTILESLLRDIYSRVKIKKRWVKDNGEICLTTNLIYEKSYNDCQQFVMSLVEHHWGTPMNFITTDLKNIGRILGAVIIVIVIFILI